MASDSVSVFSYDDEDIQGDSFSLVELNKAVNSYFGERCLLLKLSQGGYHKVYEILRSNGESLDAVARVASPAFPHDKLESEVATLKFISSRTSIPVPEVYYWNSDNRNPVGAEYMIMEKIRGVSAGKVWEGLDMKKKHRMVCQTARHLVALFTQRFAAGGSLYISSLNPLGFKVGPIISVPFYRALDGNPRVPLDDWPSLRQEQAPFRGSFNNVTDHLLCAVRAELNFLKLHRPLAVPARLKDRKKGEALVKKGESVLLKALDLYPLFPGEMPVYTPMPSPDKPFSICLDDFRLSNIMIDEATGDITGLIDLEGTTIAPVWACAAVPGWLVEEEHEDYLPGDESDEIRDELRQSFMQAITEADPSGEWERAQNSGRPYRYLLNTSKYFVVPWGHREKFVNKLLEWCKEHPGEVYNGPIDT